MRILQIIASVAPRLGGPSKAVLELSAALASQGHEVDVVTTSLAHRGSWSKWPSSQDLLPVENGRRLETGGYHITFCRPSWPTRWGMSLEMLRVLRNMIPSAAVAHIHSLYLFHTWVASRIATAVGVPYIIRPHGTLDPYIRRRHRVAKSLYHWLVEDWTLRHAAAVHFTTEEERDLAQVALPPGVESCVVPLGVDLAEFEDLPTRDSARRSLGIDAAPLVWLFLGRLNHKKGLDILAPAFAEFCDSVPNTQLVVAGPDDDGLSRAFLEECARRTVADRVRMMGFLDRQQIRQVLAAADFWILPSYSENFGLAVVEAMAARLPVLITDKVNLHRAVQDAGAGAVVRANVRSVVDGMLRLARLSPGERAAIGERGRRLCRSTFSWAASAQQLVALYARLGREDTGPDASNAPVAGH